MLGPREEMLKLEEVSYFYNMQIQENVTTIPLFITI